MNPGIDQYISGFYLDFVRWLIPHLRILVGPVTVYILQLARKELDKRAFLERVWEDKGDVTRETVMKIRRNSDISIVTKRLYLANIGHLPPYKHMSTPLIHYATEAPTEASSRLFPWMEPEC